MDNYEAEKDARYEKRIKSMSQLTIGLWLFSFIPYCTVATQVPDLLSKAPSQEESGPWPLSGSLLFFVGYLGILFLIGRFDLRRLKLIQSSTNHKAHIKIDQKARIMSLIFWVALTYGLKKMSDLGAQTSLIALISLAAIAGYRYWFYKPTLTVTDNIPALEKLNQAKIVKLNMVIVTAVLWLAAVGVYVLFMISRT